MDKVGVYSTYHLGEVYFEIFTMGGATDNQKLVYG
jgi:hypothetical protein